MLAAGADVACLGLPLQGGLQHGRVAAAAERRSGGRGRIQSPEGEIDARRAADWMLRHLLAPGNLIMNTALDPQW